MEALKTRFDAKRAELEQSGDLAAAIEHDSDGNWIGLLLAKNYEYTTPGEQMHFANKVEY